MLTRAHSIAKRGAVGYRRDTVTPERPTSSGRNAAAAPATRLWSVECAVAHRGTGLNPGRARVLRPRKRARQPYSAHPPGDRCTREAIGCRQIRPPDSTSAVRATFHLHMRATHAVQATATRPIALQTLHEAHATTLSPAIMHPLYLASQAGAFTKLLVRAARHGTHAMATDVGPCGVVARTISRGCDTPLYSTACARRREDSQVAYRFIRDANRRCRRASAASICREVDATRHGADRWCSFS